MGFIKASLKGVLACTLVWVAGCSFVPTQSQQEQPAEIPVGETVGSETAVMETPVEEHAQSINPYLAQQGKVPARAQAAFEQALKDMAAKDWKKAEQGLQQLTQDYPKLSGPYLNLALLCWQKASEECAVSNFQRAIQVNGKNLNAYNQYGIFLREKGRFKEAEEQYKKALTVWGEHPETHLNLGILYDLYMGRWQPALTHYRKYQQLTADDNRRVAGWILDLERRVERMAMN